MGWPLDRTVDSSTTQNFCARSVRPNTPAARPIDEGLGLGLGLGTLKCWGAAPSSKMKYHLPLKTLSIIQKAGCKRWWEQQVSSYMLQNSPACLNFRPNHGYGTPPGVCGAAGAHMIIQIALKNLSQAPTVG
eukprot:CAMPEP_0174342368 /NCGR_PEP_ID=MMETSP0810-20121108/26112_1 /TAXON_ID=73025 ORGANISM="Eutreptiella gymnastica-like, Strain CCMP1594" /NCGR_SAMPLE_ID=MMETSP0810 /ASSEMBLY_ACC=CAM_ASM_000659 /LENGTH=131 /DNA_ID=CAMNT_0015464475 /DNA_START=39 /DNA_END=431 /DNA_ORIENTATION=+